MTNWNDVKSKVSDGIEIVQQNPILNAIATSTIESIPVVGKLLIKTYENYKGSPEENTEQILQLLKRMQSMNEDKLEMFCSDLQSQNQKILSEVKSTNERVQSLNNKMDNLYSVVEQFTSQKHSNEKNTLSGYTTFTNSKFKITWPQSWEKVPINEMAHVHKKTREYIKSRYGETYDPSVAKLNLRQIPKKFGVVPTIIINNDSAKGENPREMLSTAVKQFSKGGFEVIDYSVDDFFQTYTIKLKANSSDIDPEFPPGIEIYQFQKGFVKNDEQVLLIFTDLSKEMMQHSPNIDKEIIDIMQSFVLL